ncbi:MAG: hypothetical protein ACREPV_05420 [Lysobacter sp.]
MKKEAVVHRIKLLFWTLLLTAYSVAAAGVVIDVFGQDYRGMSAVTATSVHSPLEKRAAGATQVAAAYRADSGAPFATLPTGSSFKVIWPDGSSEYVTVVSVSSSDGVRPIPGTQRQASEPVEGLR